MEVRDLGCLTLFETSDMTCWTRVKLTWSLLLLPLTLLFIGRSIRVRLEASKEK
jgi:hypothetical protein